MKEQQNPSYINPLNNQSHLVVICMIAHRIFIVAAISMNDCSSCVVMKVQYDKNNKKEV